MPRSLSARALVDDFSRLLGRAGWAVAIIEFAGICLQSAVTGTYFYPAGVCVLGTGSTAGQSFGALCDNTWQNIVYSA